MKKTATQTFKSQIGDCKQEPKGTRRNVSRKAVRFLIWLVACGGWLLASGFWPWASVFKVVIPAGKSTASMTETGYSFSSSGASWLKAPGAIQKKDTAGPSTEQKSPTPDEQKRKQKIQALLTYTQGMGYAMRGDYTRAIETFRKVIALDPQAPQPHVALAEIYYQLRNTKEAKSEAEQALRLDPKNEDGHRILGQIYREEALSSGDREKARLAVQELRQVVEQDETDVDAWQSLAEMYAFLEDYEKLKEALERWTGNDPSADRAFYNLAMIYFDKRQYRQAAENAARALANRPNSDYAILLARSQLYQGQTAESLQTYREALERDQSNSELRINYAEALVFSGKYDEAINSLRRILTEQPRNVEALRLTAQAHRRAGRRKEAIQTLKNALTGVDSSEALNLQYVLAQTYEEVGQVDDAVATYEEMLNALLNPDGSVAERYRRNVESVMTAMGLAYRQAGRREEAVKVFERMRKVLGAKSTQPDLLIIDTLSQERNFKAMVERARQAAEQYPDERSFKLLEAQGLAKLGQVEEAVKLLDKMLTGSSEELDVLSTKAVVLTDAERYKEAEAAIQEGLRRDPRNNGLLIQLSLIQERLGQFAASEAALRKLLENDPDNAVALNNLGYYLAERGERLQEALELIRRAVNIDPTNGAYLDSLGWVYFQLGNLDEAKHYLEQAIIYQPTDATIHEHLGDLYLRQKRADEAERAYRRALELAGESREKKQIQEKLEKLVAGKTGK